MSSGLDLWRMATTYPEMAADALGPADLAMERSWASLQIAAFIDSREDLPVLKLVWSQKPTMVHPTHVAPLAAELRIVLAYAASVHAPADALAELQAAISLSDDVAARGQWLVTIGP